MPTLELKLPYDVAVLLPTRGRTTALETAIKSLVNKAANIPKLQILLAFDEDDTIGFPYFESVIKPWLLEKEAIFSTVITPRYGYNSLHRYGNILARMAEAEWVIFWNDDAIMETDGWDAEIAKYNGKFQILSVLANREHPYSIFPIVPYNWIRILGHLTRHQQIDHEISQMAYLLDIFQRIPVHVTHDRADLTGNNKDDTHQSTSSQYDPNDPNDPNSFYHRTYCDARQLDIEHLYAYMKHLGMDTSWWDDFKSGKNKEPFSKLADNDTNFQTVAGQAKLKRMLEERKLAEENSHFFKTTKST